MAVTRLTTFVVLCSCIKASNWHGRNGSQNKLVRIWTKIYHKHRSVFVGYKSIELAWPEWQPKQAGKNLWLKYTINTEEYLLVIHTFRMRLIQEIMKHIRTKFFFINQLMYKWTVLKSNLKLTLKLILKQLPTCFGAVTPSSGSALLVVAKATVVKINQLKYIGVWCCGCSHSTTHLCISIDYFNNCNFSK